MSARRRREVCSVHPYRGVRLGRRKHLEGQLGENAERSAAADERLMQQEPGRVLHHLAAAARQSPAPVHDACADQEVADPAVAIAARSVHARRHGAAERGARRRQRRIERQVLSVLREQALDVGDAGARERRERALLGRVLDDAGERGEVEGGRAGEVPDRAALVPPPRTRSRGCSGPAASRSAMDVGLQDHAREMTPARSSGCRPCETPAPAGAASFLPVLAIPCGSIARRIRRMQSRSASLYISPRNCRFSSPTPCSPVIDPPRRMHRRRISAARTSARSCAPASRPS